MRFILTSSERGKVQKALATDLVTCECGEARHLKHARRWILVVITDGGQDPQWACPTCARDTYGVAT